VLSSLSLSASHSRRGSRGGFVMSGWNQAPARRLSGSRGAVRTSSCSPRTSGSPAERLSVRNQMSRPPRKAATTAMPESSSTVGCTAVLPTRPMWRRSIAASGTTCRMVPGGSRSPVSAPQRHLRIRQADMGQAAHPHRLRKGARERSSRGATGQLAGRPCGCSPEMMRGGGGRSH
jgi:hypothetical protein